MVSSFLEFTEKITGLFKNYSSSQQDSTQQIKNALLGFNPSQQADITKLNIYLEKQIKSVFMQIMKHSNINKLAKLISLVCQVSLENKQKSLNNRANYIRQSLAIIIVEEVLECLGINDLKQILPIISQKVSNFSKLQMNDQNRLLRVINYLLKRISKTEDYLTRGQLHFTLTKILSICHDSGFHYRISTAKGIEMVQNQQNEYQTVFNSQDITYQFYKQFWELQKYLMDPNQLTLENKSGNQETPKKVNSYKSDPLIALRLKQMEKVLQDTVNYMNKHPCSQNQTSLLNQPIKFLTNTHLLQYQLGDEYFRKIILVQVLIFAFTLKHLKPTGNILKGVMLTESERQTINKIQQIAVKQLENLERKNNYAILQKNPNQILAPSILQMMKYFFLSQLEWIELKDHWKQKKKSFLRLDLNASQNEQKANKTKDQIDYTKKISQINQKVKSQMNIDGDTLLRFLKEPCVPHIVTTPTQTSFSYYWSQGKSCLESFNFESLEQHEFETKNQYNMFQWKALRSLYRQNLTQITPVDKNPKLRQYKALAIIQKKQKNIKQKQNKQSGQIAAQTDLNQANPEVNSQNNESIQKISVDQKQMNHQQNKKIEKQDSPSKKIKPNE